jgi:hypothetical protein
LPPIDQQLTRIRHATIIIVGRCRTSSGNETGPQLDAHRLILPKYFFTRSFDDILMDGLLMRSVREILMKEILIKPFNEISMGEMLT